MLIKPEQSITTAGKDDLVSNLVGVRAEEKQVERNGGNDVDQKPSLEIVYRDFGRMTHHFVVLVDVSGTEVDQYIDDEHYVDNQIDHSEWIMISTVRTRKTTHGIESTSIQLLTSDWSNLYRHQKKQLYKNQAP
jgi:hypothetical protein